LALTIPQSALIQKAGRHMLGETRTIDFSDATLLAALSAIMRQRGESAPEGEAQIIKSRDAGGRLMVMVIYNDSNGATLDSFNFNAREVGAALILYCIQAGIPLPRAHEKSVEIHGDSVALIVSKRCGRDVLDTPADLCGLDEDAAEDAGEADAAQNSAQG